MTVRHRKVDKKPNKLIAGSKNKNAKPKNTALFIFLLIIAFVSAFSLAWYWHYIVQSRIYTPFPDAKVVDSIRTEKDDLEQLWGTYRLALNYNLPALFLLFACGLPFQKNNKKRSLLNLFYMYK